MLLTGCIPGIGKIGISWASLPSDTKDTRFNIYRIKGQLCSHKGVRLNAVPPVNTSFVDELALCLDRYPNFAVDMSAKVGDFQYQE